DRRRRPRDRRGLPRHRARGPRPDGERARRAGQRRAAAHQLLHRSGDPRELRARRALRSRRADQRGVRGARPHAERAAARARAVRPARPRADAIRAARGSRLLSGLALRSARSDDRGPRGMGAVCPAPRRDVAGPRPPAHPPARHAAPLPAPCPPPVGAVMMKSTLLIVLLAATAHASVWDRAVTSPEDEIAKELYDAKMLEGDTATLSSTIESASLKTRLTAIKRAEAAYRAAAAVRPR